MKIGGTILAILLPFLGLVSGAFEGTKEEFINTIADGHVPDGVFPESPPNGDLRKLAVEPKGVGERCGNNNPCAEGLQCATTVLGRFCHPTACVANVMSNFIERHGLQDYPERIMQRTGYYGVDVNNNASQAEKGWGGIATRPQAWLNEDFKNNLVEAMEANPPNMTELLLDVLTQCPYTDNVEAGIVVMLGLHYECAFVVPKMFNNYYFAIGTGDVNINVETPPITINSTGDDFEIQYNATGGIFTDLCFGAGPDVGFDLGITAGVLFGGRTEYLTDCSFMFDADIAVGTGFGLAVGVTSTTCVTKLMMTIGGGIGAGIGFTGCNTWELAPITF